MNLKIPTNYSGDLPEQKEKQIQKEKFRKR